MDASYFRKLAARCYRLSHSVFELRAIEEFRKLGDEFTAKANELEGLAPGTIWKKPGPISSDDEHK